MATTSQIYVIVFSNASRDIYEQNTHADFRVKLAQPVDLGSTSSCEEGLCEISCSTVPMEDDITALIYSNLISLQFVGEAPSSPCGHSATASSSSLCQHEIRNV